MAYDDEKRKVAAYEWIRVPGPDEGLAAVPEAVIEFLRALDRRFVVAPNLAPTAPTVTLAPNWAAAPTASAPNAPMKHKTKTPVPNGPTVALAPMTAEAIKARDEELMCRSTSFLGESMEVAYQDFFANF